MSRNGDMHLTCRQCGEDFVFTKSEQDFYDLKGFCPPARCRDCRLGTNNHNNNHHSSCTACGIKLDKDDPVYCTQCVNDNQVALERKIKQEQKLAKATQARLEETETKKAEIEETICQTKQLAEELELRADNLTQDLENLQESYRASAWLKPLIERLEERLQNLEKTQRESDQRLFQLIHNIEGKYEETTLLDIIKRNLVPSRGQGIYESYVK